jgi:hypothetical protein
VSDPKRECPQSAREETARRYLESLTEAADKLHMRDRPDVGISVDDDGAVTLEWMLAGRRVGLLIDPNPAESGWWFVCAIAWGGPQRMGKLDDFDAEMLVRLMMGERNAQPTNLERAVSDLDESAEIAALSADVGEVRDVVRTCDEIEAASRPARITTT